MTRERDESGDVLYFKPEIKCECCKRVRSRVFFRSKRQISKDDQMQVFKTICNDCRKTISMPQNKDLEHNYPKDYLNGANFIKFLEDRIKSN